MFLSSLYNLDVSTPLNIFPVLWFVLIANQTLCCAQLCPFQGMNLVHWGIFRADLSGDFPPASFHTPLPPSHLHLLAQHC